MRFVCPDYYYMFILNNKALKTIQNPRLYGVFFITLKQAFLPLMFLLLFFSCEEADQIGLDLIQSPVYMSATDTITLQAMTVHDDSVATSIGNFKVLGIIDDPVFGKTRASIYTETTLLANNITLGENPMLDSIHLVLAYEGGYYGLLPTQQTIKVYELSENFPESDTLFSNSLIAHDPKLLTRNPNGFKTGFSPRDSVLVDSILRVPQIRIPLSESFGQKFIEADSANFENVPNYLEFFKGLYITTGDDLEGFGTNEDHHPPGSMVRINMPAPATTLELFYRSEDDTLLMVFPVDQLTRHFTASQHMGYDDVHVALREQILYQNQYWADSLLFVQSLGMVRADIHMPYFDAMIYQPWLINKAEIVVPVQEGFACEIFPEPPQMLLMRKSEKDGLSFPADYALGVDYYGGLYDEVKQQYVFNITQYLQQLIDGEYENEGLALITARNHDRPGRVVLHGPGRTENPMRLVLYYSVFE